MLRNNNLMVQMDKDEMKIEEEIIRLTKKYQDEPDILIKDYDELIKKSIIGIIANFNTFDVLREDIINRVDTLVRIREFIVNYDSNNGSRNNEK